MLGTIGPAAGALGDAAEADTAVPAPLPGSGGSLSLTAGGCCSETRRLESAVCCLELPAFAPSDSSTVCALKRPASHPFEGCCCCCWAAPAPPPGLGCGGACGGTSEVPRLVDSFEALGDRDQSLARSLMKSPIRLVRPLFELTSRAMSRRRLLCFSCVSTSSVVSRFVSSLFVLSARDSFWCRSSALANDL